jgi:adenosylcobyric acid synthase
VGARVLAAREDQPVGMLEGGTPGSTRGLGLLPLRTRFTAEKTVRPLTVRFETLDGCWTPLSGQELRGYEIHVGRSEAFDDGHRRPGAPPDNGRGLRRALPDALGWQHGSLLGVYVHGLFENPRLVRRLFAAGAPGWDETFERLARHVDGGFGRDVLMQLLDPSPASPRSRP